MKELKIFAIAVCTATFLMSGSLTAQDLKNETKMVGGAEMDPSKNIMENAVNSKDHTRLVAAFKAAGLVGVLQGEGPFTVFAPTNSAFEKLPEGTLEAWMKPENKEALQGVLTYHVIVGDFKAVDVIAAIESGEGTATFKTVHGGEFKASLEDGAVKLKDASGNVATLTMADLRQSNGVIHVIDGVLLPAN